MSRTLLIVCLLAVVTCAFAAEVIHLDFAKWDEARWVPVREAAFNYIGKVAQKCGYIENWVPPGSADKDITSCKVGATLRLLKGFSARDFEARTDIAFLGTGAPAIILRAQRQREVTGLMYTLVIYKDGINLWRYDGKKWGKVAFTKFPIAPEKFHSLQVHARGNSFVVHVDGVRVLNATEAESLPAGEVGLWLGEGIVRVKSFSVRPLTPSGS